ncbi:MAG TPA: hypothetical protein GXZ35_01555 [Acholeplasmataceae bacterium]|nr:hypothetical protein [Acholeplasmataceae bacterium]
MEEYRPNSHKYKEDQKRAVPEKKVEKVITGTVKSKKKSEIQKFTDVFISEDVNNVKSYILLEVLVPAIKKAISDIVTNGIDMILYGETGKTKSNTAASKVSYRSYYDSRRDYSAVRTRTGYNYDDIIFDNRGEAEDVLTRMDELISTYGLVSVADLYDLVGVTGNYTDNKYGWTDIRSASVVRVRDGYMIKLPKALPLN